jgi:hypothetical protein
MVLLGNLQHFRVQVISVFWCRQNMLSPPMRPGKKAGYVIFFERVVQTARKMYIPAVLPGY